MVAPKATGDVITNKIGLKTYLRINKSVVFKRSPLKKVPFIQSSTGEGAIWFGKSIKKVLSETGDEAFVDWLQTNTHKCEIGLLRDTQNWVLYIPGESTQATVIGVITDSTAGAETVGTVK